MMPAELPWIIAASFGAGFVDSMVGGGGLIMVPALFAAFPRELPTVLLGTGKIASICGTVTAVARYSRSVAIAWRFLLPAAVLTFACSLAGAYTVTRVPVAGFRPLVPVLLSIVACYTFLHRDFGERHAPHVLTGARWWIATVLIAAIGFYEGFFGPGTGSFFMFMFVRVFGYDFLNAAASARLLNVAGNAAALVFFATRVELLWVCGLSMAVSNVAGSLVGTRLALRRGAAFVRVVFLLVVAALIAKTAWDAITA
ncbi:MAG TPA: TSUP family transporter [Steroidobacteraceae bacterium]|nr:TSUP family transporter [Steroidobacteraceae bacterium]